MSDECGSEFAEDDDLRALLSDLDPMSARVPVEEHTSPRARHQLEQIMSQSTEHETVAAKRAGRGKTWLAAAAAVAAIAIGTTVAVNANGGGDDAVVAQPKTVIALQTAGGDPMMQSCIPFDLKFLREMPVAFGGVVTAIDTQNVTLDVDRWFKGGNADQVTIAIPSGQTSAALDGVDFEQGARYLITATEGTVNGCGYSGPATAEFEKYFEQAFPAAS